ncbi:nucleolar protein,Nop52-domain-containing protein [Phlyctochytrium arcticum]|nr:nucleolar protein,Nop52-domain-containing protein [Phlyctochytrium arcticum]
MAKTSKADNDESTPSGFGRQLAHTDKKIRDRAVRSLAKYLTEQQGTLTELQLLKLWKGLFYAFWMSDKPLIQQHLADKLASLALRLPDPLALSYIETFWKTIVKDWHGIDRLRLDKYYMLLRKFHYYAFQYLQSKEWDAVHVASYTKILAENPLRINDLRVPDSLRYHVAEVFVEELERAVVGGDDQQQKAIPDTAFLLLLSPFFDNVTQSRNDIFVSKILESVFEPLLFPSSSESEDADAEDEQSQEKKLTVPVALLGERLKALAVGEEGTAKNRKRVAALVKKL